ncbi:polyprenyl synthetase family protein [bacterium]|nr:polyprenyl synthetase family protein [bacterium]
MNNFKKCKIDLKQYLKKRREVVNQVLNKYLKCNNKSPRVIQQSMRYSVFSGGKRLRPILVLCAAEICGRGGYKKALAPACALEMIHAYSLIHDDLPAMDNDDYRRNKLTSHKKFGEAMAILTGDALLTYAFQIVADDLWVKKEMISELAKAAGREQMLGGQVEDIQNSGCKGKRIKSKNEKTRNVKKINYIHACKTGALIKTSLKMGAMAVNASKKQIKALEEYGKNIGLAFQVMDDVLDVVGNKKKLGKRGSDFDNSKLTYPLIYGVEKSKEKAVKLVEKAKQDLSVFGQKANILKKIADYLINREY